MSESNALPQKPRRNWLTFLPVLLAAVILIGFAYPLLRGGDPSVLPSALIGKPVPPIDLQSLPDLKLDGQAVPGLTTADFKKGGVTVVNIFASWCVPCQDEHPVLMKFAALREARLVGINYKDDPANARRFLGTFGLPYAAVGVDANGRSAIDWGVYGVPETFVVNGDGVIVDKIVGPMNDEIVAGRLRQAIEAAGKR